jgi:response regulator RpfG family c-di-GMP phosphodiesterase/PAS domain-containing protein
VTYAPNILVIDDDPSVRKTLADILRIKGYEVASAENGASGIAEALRIGASVVLIDLKLPDMSGIEVMGKIKAAAPFTEAIILTGHASLDTAVEAINQGAFSYLLKPYEVEKLLRHIGRALDRQQSQQEITRLASFPQLNPNPVLEVNAAGELTYINPAAARVFPDLAVAQPVLGALGDVLTAFGMGERKEAVREFKVGKATFEQYLYPVPESDLTRVYMLDISERVRSETAIRESEARYRSLFENMLGGLAYCRMLYQDNVPSDFVYLDVNPAFETLTGLKDVIGKKASEVIPGIRESNPELFDVYGRVAASGKPEKLETYVPALDIWFSLSVYSQRKGYFVALFDNITVRKLHEVRLNKLNALLSVLRDINEKLLVAESESELFQYVCESLKTLEDIAIVWIIPRNPNPEFMPVACAGVSVAELSALQVPWDDVEKGVGFIGQTMQKRETVTIQNADDAVQFPAWQSMVRQWNVKSAIAVPIHTPDEIIATLSVFSSRQGAFDEEFVRFLHEVAGDIAIGVHSLNLDKSLHTTLDHLRSSMNSTVEAIASMVELRDPYTAGHERRVAQLASAIGKEMGLPERQVEGLRVIGYLHDIGKIAVPAEILSKPGRLSEAELAMVRLHPMAGYNILKNLEFPWPVAQAVLQHHERIDGSGYPQGITGKDIIIEARILMVADVVEAMASHRPYRSAIGLKEALAEITKNRGTLYCEKAVDTCIRLFNEKGFEFSA